MPSILAWRGNEALIDTSGALVSSNALNVAGQADVVLIASHRVSLSHPRDVRQRLGFVRAPPDGYVNLQPLGLGVRAVWGRITRGSKRGTAIGKVVVDPERRA